MGFLLTLTSHEPASRRDKSKDTDVANNTSSTSLRATDPPQLLTKGPQPLSMGPQLRQERQICRYRRCTPHQACHSCSQQQYKGCAILHAGAEYICLMHDHQEQNKNNVMAIACCPQFAQRGNKHAESGYDILSYRFVKASGKGHAAQISKS